MPLLRFDPLTTGSANPEAFTVLGQRAYLGKGGNDSFNSNANQFDGLAMGGRGDDIYILSGRTELLVYERGASTNDRVSMNGIGLFSTYQGGQTVYATIDGQHLFMGNINSGQSVILLNWRAGDNVIENFTFSNGNFTWAQVNATVFGANYGGNVTWEQLNSTGAFPYTTADVNEGLAYYAALEPFTAPLVTPTAAVQSLTVGSTVQASSLFSVTDVDGDPVVQYQFYDGGTGGGRFRVNGVDRAAMANIDVVFADLGNTVYVAGPGQGSETLWVRAYDGFAWSEWKSWTETTQRVTNLGAPQIGGPATRNSEVQQWHRLSDFLTLSDADGDAPVRFTISDNAGGATSAQLYANGATQAQGVSGFVVATSDLSTIWVRGGADTGHNTFTITADDGLANGVGNAFTFDLWTRAPNRAPVVTAPASQGLGVGTTVAASTLFSVTDADGDTMTQYQFYDGGAGGGQFRVNGVGQASGASITVDAANLANTVYAAGGTQGSETLWVRVNDGIAWSEWKSWTQVSQRTTNAGAPQIGGQATRNSEVGQWHQLSSFLTITDADGDRPVRFTITDNSGAAGSALLYANGMTQAQGASGFVVTASDLSGVWVQGGTSTGHNTFSVTADDGLANGVGNTFTFDLHTRAPNSAPVVTAPASQGLGVGTTVQASTLFSVTDADNDTMVQYQFYDGGAGGGQFRVNGTGQASGVSITVDAANLGNTVYAAGSSQGSETLWVRVNDGIAWSEWRSWTEVSQRTTNAGAPQIGGPATRNSEVQQWHQLSSFLNVTDADGDRPVSFRIVDNNSGAGSGELYANGRTYSQAEGAAGVTVAASDLSGVWVRGGTDTGHNGFSVTADDGLANGVGNTFNFDLWTRAPNRAPVVTALASQGLGVGTTVQASSLFSVTDADGDTMVQYQFYDGGAGGGQFRVNGAGQAALATITVDAAQLGNTVYAAGATQGSETLWVRVNDGIAWSEWKSWTETSQRTTNAGAPQISGPATRNSEVQQWHQLSTFLNVTDADGDRPASFRIVDNDSGAGTGELYANGRTYSQAEGAAGVTVLAGDLSGVWVRGATGTGHNTFSVTADDGLANGVGNTFTFDLNTRGPNRAPVVSVQPFATGPGQAMPVERLFSVSDADGDAVVTYRFWDGGAGGGYFMVNGQQRGASQNIDVSAANLANAIYVGGSSNGSESLSVQVFDGLAWSEWKTFSMSTALLSHFPETAGTRNADSIAGNSNSVFHGLSGDDSFFGQQSFASFFVGGAGGDTYTVGLMPNFTYVVEDGNSAGDALVFPYFNFANVNPNTGTPTSFVGLLDGRHLLLAAKDSGSNVSAVIVFDWQDPARRLESWTLGGNPYTYDQFRTAALNSGPRNYTYAELGLGDSAGVMNEALAWYRQREIELDVNHAPVVSATGLPVPHHQRVALAPLFSATDPDLNPVVTYEFTDLAAGGGSLWINGVQQASGALATVQAGNLAQVQYQATAPGAADTLRVRAFDGSAWSAPYDLVLTPVNRAPVLSAAAPGTVLAGVPIAVTTGIGYSDADGDAALSYEFTDLSAGGGRFRIGGIGGTDQAQGATVVVQTADLAQAFFVPGAAGSTETYRVRAWDGYDWSAARDVTLSPQVNHAPVITTSDRTLRIASTAEGVSQSLQLQSLYTVNDPDGSAPYGDYTDNGAGGGYLTVNGVQQASGTPISPAGGLALVYYHAAATPGTETLTIRASDGGLSDTRTINVTSVLNDRPVVTGTDALRDVGQTINLVELFASSDSDTLQRFQVRAPTGLALASGQNATLIEQSGGESVYEIGQPGLNFLTGASNQDAVLSVRAWDGIDWSEWEDATLRVRGGDTDLAGNTPGSGRAITLSAAPQTFHDWVGSNDQIDFYRFSLPTGGKIDVEVDGLDRNVGLQFYKIQAPGVYQQHASFGFISSFSDPNGVAFSFFAPPGDYAFGVDRSGTPGTYYDLSLAGAANEFPVVVPVQTQVATQGSLSGFELFHVRDGNGDFIQNIGVTFTSLVSGNGYFTFNNLVTPAVGETYNMTLNDLALLRYNGGDGPGEWQVTVRAYDGHAYGDYQTWSILTLAPGNQPPAVVEPGGTDGAGNTRATGRNVTLSATQQVFSDELGPGDTVDFYNFTLTGPVHVRLGGLDANGGIAVSLQNADGTPIGGTAVQASGGSSAPAQIDVNLVAGTYSLQLVNMGTSTTGYDLTLYTN
jgi:hypothetical protein